MNTHKGLYAYQRLTYCIASAPAIFQSTMDQILQGMNKVHCRVDDILIRTEPHENLQVLDEALTRLEKHGILAKRSKCEFKVPSVEFLGVPRRPGRKASHRLQLLEKPRAQRVWKNFVPIWGCSTTMEMSYSIYPGCYSHCMNCSRKE